MTTTASTADVMTAFHRPSLSSRAVSVRRCPVTSRATISALDHTSRVVLNRHHVQPHIEEIAVFRAATVATSSTAPPVLTRSRIEPSSLDRSAGIVA